MIRIVATILLSTAVAGGCVVHERPRPAAVVVSSPPDLAEVAPGVQVIADYDEPIFFVDGWYWWFLDGFWYRSTTYTTGWSYVATPPVVIVRIQEPHRYRHYRPHGYVVRRRPVPSAHLERPQVRDHRTDRPKVRDHR